MCQWHTLCAAFGNKNESFYTSARGKRATKGCIEPIKSQSTESTWDLLQLLTADSTDKRKRNSSLVISLDCQVCICVLQGILCVYYRAELLNV